MSRSCSGNRIQYLQYQRSMKRKNGNVIAVLRDRITKKIYYFTCTPVVYQHSNIRIWEACLIVDNHTPCLLSMKDANQLLAYCKLQCPTRFTDIFISRISEKNKPNNVLRITINRKES